MKKSFYYIFCLICIAGIILVSGCSLNGTKSEPSGTSNDIAQNKLTLDQIQQSYAKTDEKIISIKEYGNYILVESNPPNSPTFFTLYDLKTGDKDIVTNIEYRIDSERTKYIDKNHIILYAKGTNSVYAFQTFPFEIHCMRGSENTGSSSDFISNYKDIKLPIAEQISLGGKGKEEVIDIRVSVNGLQVCFGPQSSDDALFGAAYVDSPSTDISYDETKGEFTLKFKDTRFAKTYADISSLPYNNAYIKSLDLKESENSAIITIKLNAAAKYYIGKKDSIAFDMLNSLAIPYMDIQFFNSNMVY